MSILRDIHLVRFKDRHPDPGVCRVISIDYESQHVGIKPLAGGCHYGTTIDQLEDVVRDLDQIYRLDQTSGACPEAYDIFDREGDVCIGKMRLRHGYFTVRVYGPGEDDTVYETSVKGDGLFESDERDHHIQAGLRAVDAAMLARQAR